ncbi:unnamed protein product, partial [Brassica oleracea var. botrytis]
GTETHVETEWNNIRRVDEVSGIQHTRISDSLISSSSGLVSNKRGLDSIGLVVYGSGKSKLLFFVVDVVEKAWEKIHILIQISCLQFV